MMKLLDYKEKVGVNYNEMSQETGIPRSLLHRMCTEVDYCCKLVHAHVITQWSDGEVTYEDMLNGDC